MAYAERLSRTHARLIRECGSGAQSGFGVTQTDRMASRSIALELSEHAPPLLPAPDAQSNCIDPRQIARSCPKPRKLHINCVISSPYSRALKAVELHIDCVISPLFESAQSSGIEHRLSNFSPQFEGAQSSENAHRLSNFIPLVEGATSSGTTHQLCKFSRRACPVPPQSTGHRKARPGACPASLQEPANNSSRHRHNLPTPNPGCTPKDQSIEAAKKT